ncbi:MAG: hypothetical protein AAFQ21_16365 [Pseudomonadota bacterium]
MKTLVCWGAAVALYFLAGLGAPSFAQPLRDMTEQDLRSLNQQISSEQVEVFLVRNGGIQERARTCTKIRAVGGDGALDADGSEVTISMEGLQVFTPASAQKIISEFRQGYRSCLKDRTVRSHSPIALLSEDGTPFSFEFTLGHSFCYVRATYADCSTDCFAAADPGAGFHRVVIGREQAERFGKTTCGD